MDINDLLSEARACIQQGRHEEADELIREVLRYEPENLVAWRLAERNARDPEQKEKISLRIERILNGGTLQEFPQRKRKRMPGVDPDAHRPKAKIGQPVTVTKKDRGMPVLFAFLAGILFICGGALFIPIAMGNFSFTVRMNDELVLNAIGENTRATLEAEASQGFSPVSQSGWLPAGVHLAGTLAPGRRSVPEGNDGRAGLAGWNFFLGDHEGAQVIVMPASPLVEAVTLYVFMRTDEGNSQFVGQATQLYGGVPLEDAEPLAFTFRRNSGRAGEYVAVVEVAGGDNTGGDYTIKFARVLPGDASSEHDDLGR